LPIFESIFLLIISISYKIIGIRIRFYTKKTRRFPLINNFKASRFEDPEGKPFFGGYGLKRMIGCPLANKRLN